MARRGINNEENFKETAAEDITEQNELDELIPIYYANKLELDSYKALCDYGNARIKELMLKMGVDTHRVNDLVAKRIVQKKETINEAKLIEIIKKHKIQGVIQTKEYVDMNALESYLYNNEISADLATDLNSCKTTNEVIQLRVSKKKGSD